MLVMRVVYFLMGVLLIVAACYLALHLYRDRDMIILASVSPGIVAAFVFGTILIIRSIERFRDQPGQDS